MNAFDRLFSGMRIVSSGLSAERKRIDVIAENIANARTTKTLEGTPYRRKMVVFEPLLERAYGRGRSGASTVGGVQVPRVLEDHSSDFERILEPGHPDADANGMVAYPNVNTVMEMADLITALRAYEANITAQENFVRIAERTLQLIR